MTSFVFFLWLKKTVHQFLQISIYNKILVAANPSICISNTIVNRRKWLGRPENIKEANKKATIYVGKSLTLHVICVLLIDYA